MDGREFRDMLHKLRDRFESFESREATMRERFSGRLDMMVSSYESNLDDVCCSIAMENHMKILKTLNRIDKSKENRRKDDGQQHKSH